MSAHLRSRSWSVACGCTRVCVCVCVFCVVLFCVVLCYVVYVYVYISECTCVAHLCGHPRDYMCVSKTFQKEAPRKPSNLGDTFFSIVLCSLWWCFCSCCFLVESDSATRMVSSTRWRCRRSSLARHLCCRVRTPARRWWKSTATRSTRSSFAIPISSTCPKTPLRMTCKSLLVSSDFVTARTSNSHLIVEWPTDVGAFCCFFSVVQIQAKSFYRLPVTYSLQSEFPEEDLYFRIDGTSGNVYLTRTRDYIRDRRRYTMIVTAVEQTTNKKARTKVRQSEPLPRLCEGKTCHLE